MDVKKRKKSRTSKNKDSSAVPDPNSRTPSPTLEESPHEKKRKRSSESSHKKQKKHKHRSTGNELENGDPSVNPVEDELPQSESVATKAPQKSTENDADSPPQDATSEANTETTSTGKVKKIRGSRIGGKNNMKVGFFVKEEVSALETFKVNFCNLHGFTDHKKFDEMVQHSEREGGEWPCPADVCTKTEFWTQIYDLVPDRDRRSLYRFMRRHFQDSMQKPHEWTPEQDKELVTLMTQHPGRWAYVAKLLGRSDDDVTQRWKNQLEHRGKMNRGKWSEEELRSLMDAIQKIWISAYNIDRDTAGKDMYELPEKHLRWGVISDDMGNVRSRQQCADKWRKIRRSVEVMRATGNPDAVYDPVEAANKRTRWGSGSVTPKSAYLVGDDDEDDDNPKDKIETSAPINGLGIFADATQTPASEEAPTSQPTTEQDSQAEHKHEIRSPATSTPSSPANPPKKKHLELNEPAEPSSPLSSDAEDKAAQKAEQKATKKAEKEKRKRERRERRESNALVAAIEGSIPIESLKEKDKKSKKHKSSVVDVEAEAENTATPKSKKKSRKSTDAGEERTSTDSHKKKKRKSIITE
ncbi:hypothetical protein N7520_008622 [Penicillium odoratum]|uniref:uncharacterized protein n=1 Tax=Penicillium odoratum TaxID=1167516 RepID=UPI0025483FB9|nr:uncharacterized protein N7520_008622 [Penicillium odoratum]KAJ5751705.1 hypothetical protein N7520_008622 [Penicillium odoratum]